MESKALEIFKEETEAIVTAEVKVFVENALRVAPANFYGDEEIVEDAKKAMRILAGFLEEKKIEGVARDAMLAAAMVADIAKGSLPDDYKHLHPVAARKVLSPILTDVNPGIFESIIRGIEGHEGENSPSEALKPRQGSAEYEIAMAFSVARMACVHVEI